jgi:hypothetical protein
MQRYNNGPIIFIFTWSTVFPEKLAVPQLVKIFPPLYENQKFDYGVDNRPPQGSTLSQLNLCHILISHFITTHFKLATPRCTKRSDSCRLFNCIPVRISHLSIHSSMALRLFVGPWPLLQFCNLFYTDGRTPWTGDEPVARSISTDRTTRTQNKRTHRFP